jgi:hypothetical protein
MELLEDLVKQMEITNKCLEVIVNELQGMRADLNNFLDKKGETS